MRKNPVFRWKITATTTTVTATLYSISQKWYWSIWGLRGSTRWISIPLLSHLFHTWNFLIYFQVFFLHRCVSVRTFMHISWKVTFSSYAFFYQFFFSCRQFSFYCINACVVLFDLRYEHIARANYSKERATKKTID